MLAFVATVAVVSKRTGESVSQPSDAGEVATDNSRTPSTIIGDVESERSESPSDDAVYEVTDGLADGDVIELGGTLIGKRILIENCRAAAVPVLGDGSTDYVGSQECERNVHYDEPYDSMSRQDLEILAETDAAAALVLGDKLAAELGAGKEIVMRLYMHALALSAHPDAFEALYNYINGGHGVVYTDGELNLDRAARAYVWSSVGNRLGYTSEEVVEMYRNALVRNGQALDELDPDIDHWTTVIAERRNAVETGAR